LLKAIRKNVSEKLKTADEKEENKWRAIAQVVKKATPSIRIRTLNKIVSLGITEASQIKSLKEAKHAKLDELERIRTFQRELSTGRFPFLF
ncbi:hypothetical protein HYY75_06655, partial [bacterium]|nr:hypothetical protein [bacterium]